MCRLESAHSRRIDWVVCKTTCAFTFFSEMQKRDYYRFLSCCARSLEHRAAVTLAAYRLAAP